MLIRGLIVLITFSFFSCGQDRIFDNYKTIQNHWDKDSLIIFEVDLKSSSYNTFINVRTDQSYKFNNLFLIVTVQDSVKTIMKDTIQYKMANSDGKFLNTFENKLVHKESIKFESGKYLVTIQHAMRKINQIKGLKLLDGILNIGYRIEKEK
jgi:gliding motility-associated lipoprotein GldH